jgi:hypothetical protein
LRERLSRADVCQLAVIAPSLRLSGGQPLSGGGDLVPCPLELDLV